MKKVTLLALMLLLSTVTFPQPPETDQAIKAEVQKLGSIVGDWKGEGWMM